MAAATHEDAQLIVQLMQWSTAAGIKEASNEVFADDFDPDTADPMSDSVGVILALGEAIGAFVKHDVLNRDLAADFFWLDGMWARVGPAALRARERAGEPSIFENFEALARPKS